MVPIRWVGATDEREKFAVCVKKSGRSGWGFLLVLLRFFRGVRGKWVSLWWLFGGENVV
jgi:hypothetical protein